MARRKATSGRTQKVKRKTVSTRMVHSKPVVPTEGRWKGKRVYRKGGDIHEVDYAKDSKRKAKTVRTRNQYSYVGDLKGSRV